MDYISIANFANIILSEKDPYNHHGSNVSIMSMKIASGMNNDFSRDELLLLYYGSRLHDVGKILLDDVLLNYPRRLTHAEYARMQSHVQLGYNILQKMHCNPIICNMVYAHHEHYNGSGYPRKLIGKDIPVFSRIICIADAWDSMTNDRAYRKAMPFEEALEEMNRTSEWFDPDIYPVFLDVIRNDNQ